MRALCRWVILPGVLAVSMAGGQGAFAQQSSVPTQQSIQARLEGPFLMLRGMYDGDKLTFDAQGRLKQLAGVIPFSLSAVRVERVKLSGGKLEIEGRREGLEFAAPEMRGEPMTVSAAPWSQNDRIEVTIKFDQHHAQDLYPLLDKIFSRGLDDAVVPGAPDYWQPWLRHWLHPDDPADRLRAVIAEDGGASCRGDGFTPPRLLNSVEPDFSDAARMARYEGVVVVHMTVDESGRPQRIFIVRPLGMGLDDNAVNAVRQYEFNPGTKDGEPLACESNVEVSFRLGGM